MRTPAIALGLGLALGCGNGATQAPAPAAVARPAIEASYDEAAGGREVVARVDGAPIYADCVAAQLAAPGRAAAVAADLEAARRAALDECVGFELMAQEARRRGLTRDADAVEAQRREAVRALVAREFGPTFDSPDDVGRDELVRFWPKLQRFFDHGELRSTYYCRYKLKRGVVTGGPEDLEAERQARALHATYFAGKTVDKAGLIAACGEATRTHKMEIIQKPYTFENGPGTSKAYADAVFALREVGQVTPPTRTDWGWDLILFAELTPPVHATFAQAEPELRRMFFYDDDFQGYRENRFLTWAREVGKAHQVEVHVERIPATEQIQAEALGAAAGSAPAVQATGEAPVAAPGATDRGAP